jgi:hypothetical protein
MRTMRLNIRMGIHGPHGALALGLSLLLTACATSPATKEAKSDPRLQRTTAVLLQRGDPDSLAAAALLSFVESHETSLALLVKATAAAPERADLTWLHAQACREVTSCDPGPVEQRLRDLDPSNGAGWMGALSRATIAKDEAAMERALAAMGHSARVDIYWTTLIAHLSRATELTKTLSLPETEVTVIGVLAALAIPAYAAAPNACKGERLQRPDMLETCRGVAKAFERGDTYITEMIGIAIAKRVWPEESPEYQAATEARRTFDYRSRFWQKDPVYDSPHAEAYLSLCAKNRREQDVLSAQMIEAGENPNPPRD